MTYEAFRAEIGPSLGAQLRKGHRPEDCVARGVGDHREAVSTHSAAEASSARANNVLIPRRMELSDPPSSFTHLLLRGSCAEPQGNDALMPAVRPGSVSIDPARPALTRLMVLWFSRRRVE